MACYLPWVCLFLVLSVVHSMFLSCSGCFMEERAAIMDIRSLFITAQSEVPNSWGQSEDCCSWEGITCNNGTRKISRLKLSEIYQLIPNATVYNYWNMSLAIFSPFLELQLLDFDWASLQNFEGLQGLSKLKYLDLSDNILLESIPGSVGKLVSLEDLNLNGNNMSGALHNTDFQNLHNLRELHLGSNKLSGTLPTSIFALPYLEHLDLSENLFEGHIPINSSWKLRKLDLRSNKLSGSIPSYVFELPYLEYLDLSENLLQGHIPINSSWNLRELNLRSNQLSGSIPSSVFVLPCLEYLDLSENLLQGHIPINSSWKCSSLLQTIRLSENKLSGIFDFFWLRKCMNIEWIDLSGNTDLVVQVKLHGWVPKFQLKILMLSLCNLDRSIIREPHFLRTQRYLQFLDLSNNNLPGSMPNWLFRYEACNIPSMKTILDACSLSFNPLHHVIISFASV